MKKITVSRSDRFIKEFKDIINCQYPSSQSPSMPLTFKEHIRHIQSLITEAFLKTIDEPILDDDMDDLIYFSFKIFDDNLCITFDSDYLQGYFDVENITIRL